MYKKTKGGGGQGESPDANCVMLKKSRVEYYIFFSPFSLELQYDIYMIKAGKDLYN